jgi:hypothetical protein
METTIWICTFIIVATLVGGFYVLNDTLNRIEYRLEEIRDLLDTSVKNDVI